MTTTYESATNDLIDAVARVVEPWLIRVAIDTYAAHLGSTASEFRTAAESTAREGSDWVVARLRATLEVDVDVQRVNPLQTLREAVRFPTAVLRAAGVPVKVRDEYDEKINPDDVYGIGPAHWNDIDESLVEPGIVWGAAKASTVLQRRRAEGKLDPK
ncbi:MAG: hypothetical protein RIQ64_1217 [Actinomycetota bacterium]|jgi:hypothetical protein